MVQPTAREQELVDLLFEVGLKSAEYMHRRSRDDIAAWIAKALADSGFPNAPCGMSWGVLSQNQPDS